MKSTILIISAMLCIIASTAQSSTRYVFKCDEKMHYTIVSQGDTLVCFNTTKRLTINAYQEACVIIVLENGTQKIVYLDQVPGIRKQVVEVTPHKNGTLIIKPSSND